MEKRLPLSKLLMLPVLLLGCMLAQAQISINYPSAAQGLTRGYGQSNLTVQAGFTGACSGTTVTVALPASVTYVPGSAAKTGGSLAGSTITESNISNLNAPVFALSNITAAGDITFTIARQAGCGSLGAAKDTVKVAGSCGSFTENGASVNTYNLLSPAFSITPAAAITNAFIGNTFTRSISITNGGNGCADTVRFYTVYPAGGIVNTASNAITANGTSFSPSSTNGDTLFYKIYGAAIFGGDNLLCNGETVNITEPIKIAKCATTTTYGAGWGKNQAAWCQTYTATSNISMALGVPNILTTIAEPVQMGACTPGTVTVTYNNNGTGANAGAAYNLIPNLGIAADATSMQGKNKGNDIGNFTVNGLPLTVTTAGTLSSPYLINLNQLTTDPDGAGTGLEDLDGDGQFDDLAPGKSFTITFKRTYQNDTVSCPAPAYQGGAASKLSYSTMCGASNATAINIGGNGYNNCCLTTSINAPLQVSGGSPFNVSVSWIEGLDPAFYRPTDSLEIFLTLPAGVTYAGNAQFKGTAADYVMQTGQLLTIRKKGIGSINYNPWGQTAAEFSFDLLYTCGSSSTLNIPIQVNYVIDRSCNAYMKLFCTSLSINTYCPVSICPDGILNYAPKVQRQTLGWTDYTMSTKVTAAALPPISLKTVSSYDTLQVTAAGKEGTISYNNLYYNFQMDRAASTDLLQFINGTFNYSPAGGGTVVSVPITSPAGSSTATISKWTWNLSPLLGSGGLPAVLNAGDSVWVDIKYRVTDANSGLLLGSTIKQATNALSYFYNSNSSSSPVFCGTPMPEVYFIGMVRGGPKFSGASLSGCSSNTVGLVGAVVHTNPLQPYVNEFRPAIYIDSFVVTLPVGVSYDPSVTPTYSGRTYASRYQEISTAPVSIGNPVIRGKDLIFINPGTWQLQDFSTSAGGISLKVVADCSAGSITTSLPVTLKYYGKDYFYAAPAPAVPLIPSTMNYTTGLTVDGTKRPAISIQDNTGTVQGVLPQHYWDVEMNSTGTVTAPYLWMAMEKSTGSGGISIDSVVLKPSNQVIAPLNYNVTDKWYKVSAAGLTTGSNQKARIYFKYANCSTDSILMKSGWNCTGYPNSDPLTGYACSAAQQYLKVIPQTSQVQLSIARQPGNNSSVSLCTSDSVLIIVNSAQAGNLLAPYVNVYAPAGATIQLPVQIEYPAGSGIYQAATTSVIAGGYKIDLASHTGIGANGLPGTILNPTAPGRQSKLKVMFTTSCGITSGSPLVFEAYGIQPCGAAAIGSGIQVNTAGINITGATVAGSAGVTLSLGTFGLDCGVSTKLNLSTTPVITPTQPGDTVTYTIPAGLAYGGNFTGAGFGTITTASGPGGSTLVKVPLPAGAAAGTTLNYSFDVTASGIGGCGNTTISASAKRDIPALVCGGTPCTGSSVIIGSATSASLTLAKPALSTGALTYAITGTTVKTMSYSFTITNTGTAFAPAGAYLAKLFCASPAGPLLSTFTTIAVPINATVTQTGSFTFTNLPGCNGNYLYLEIQDTTAAGAAACLCSSPTGTLTGNVVPVRIASFSAVAKNCNAALSWATSEEVNLNRFDIEQSSDGTSFAKIAAAASHGISTGSAYTGLYSQPAGTAYYRLRMVSNDGSSTYSDVVPVKTSCTATGVQVYPNPAKEKVIITGLTKNSTVRLTDAAGRVLASFKAVGSSTELNISRYPDALYLLQIIKEDQSTETIKLNKN